ncbi:MAG: ECF transporter S component [Defluviitaleaceae bacterium]|nr:ECF transporter S component [Defluviitaleaceae bacterium]
MNYTTKKLVVTALLIALGVVLPTFTGPALGSILLPMHIPALLAGFVIDKKYAAIAGFTMPLFRSTLFGMPPMFPTAVAMSFELAAYGFMAGLMYELLASKKVKNSLVQIYGSLVVSLIVGRLVWGIVTFTLLTGFNMGSGVFTFAIFINSVLITSWIGITIQIIIIPILVKALEKSGVTFSERQA